MRVLHVITSDQRRGAETSALDIAARLSDRGHATRVVALEGTGYGSSLDVEVLPGAGRLSARALAGLRTAARQCDVVLAHGSTTLPACAMALSGTGKPFVYANIGDPTFWADTSARRLRVRVLLSRAARVAALSGSSATVLHQSFRVPKDKLTVIGNGRDVLHFRPVTPEDRRRGKQRLGLDGDEPVVLMLGALSPEKQVPLGLTAVGELEDTHLLLAGAGPEEARLRVLAEQLLPGRCHFLGQQADVRPVLAASDVLLMTSSSEGLPGVLIEAALSGVPAVSLDVGLVPDAVRHGATGYLVQEHAPGRVAEALRLALAEADVLGPAARTFAERTFDIEKVVDDWERVLTDAAGS